MAYRRNYRRSAPVSRWLECKFDGTCKVCGRTIPAGEHAFWDCVARTVTCNNLECCKADGLTRDVWHGSPVSGSWQPTVAASRIGGGYVRDPGEDMADRWNERQ